MEHSKSRRTLAAGVGMAGIAMTVALAVAVWPALTRPDPPLEARGDEGLRISLVEPPRTAMPTNDGSRLDVGLPDVAQATTQGREVLLVATPPVRQEPRPVQPPAQVVEADDEDALPPPPEPADDRWAREARHLDRFEETQGRRWEEERRWAREDRAEMRRAELERRRWEEARERERHDDRYAPVAEPEDDRPPPSGW